MNLEDPAVVHGQLAGYGLDQVAVPRQRDQGEARVEHRQLLDRSGDERRGFRPEQRLDWSVLSNLRRSSVEMVSRRVLERERSRRCLISSRVMTPPLDWDEAMQTSTTWTASS